MLQRLKMIPQCMGHTPCTHDQHIPRLDSCQMPPVHPSAATDPAADSAELT